MGARELTFLAALTVLCCSDSALALPVAPQVAWMTEFSRTGIISVRWRYRYRHYWVRRDAYNRGDMTTGLGGIFQLAPPERTRSVPPRRRGGWVDPPPLP